MGEVKNIQVVTLTDRSRLVITSVSAVLSFDDDYLKIDGANGIILVEGSDLLIENLSKERGEIVVVGRIDKLEFLNQKKKK